MQAYTDFVAHVCQQKRNYYEIPYDSKELLFKNKPSAYKFLGQLV